MTLRSTETTTMLPVGSCVPALGGGPLLDGAQAGEVPAEDPGEPGRLAQGVGRGRAQQDEPGGIVSAFVGVTEGKNEERGRPGQRWTAQAWPEGLRRELDRL